MFPSKDRSIGFGPWDLRPTMPPARQGPLQFAFARYTSSVNVKLTTESYNGPHIANAVTGISEIDLCFAHPTLHLPWIQQICHWSRPQLDRAIGVAKS